MKRFKLKANHCVAAPFMLLAALGVYGFFNALPVFWRRSWDHAVFQMIFSLVFVFVAGAPAFLAWKRQWSDFVKIVLGLGCFMLFGLLVGPIDGLSEQVEDLQPLSDQWPAIHGVWVVVLRLSPFFLAYGLYRWLHGPVIRRLEHWMPADADTKKARPPAGAPVSEQET